MQKKVGKYLLLFLILHDDYVESMLCGVVVL
jgi:hypothetical protein